MAQSAPTALYGEERSFYVPHFELSLDGKPAPPAVRFDILSVSYHDSILDVDSCELQVNNWDAKKGRVKYGPPAKEKGTFHPGTKLELKLGYLGKEDELRTMTRAVVTSVDASFSESAAHTLSVRALNELHSLRETPHTYSWTNKTDSEIAEELGKHPRSKDRPGLGIEVRATGSGEQTHEFVFMNNQQDILFLLERARLHDYEVVLHEAENGGKKHLTFGPSDSASRTYRLEWGKSLISFRPTVDTSKQVGEVVVHGWDRHRNEAIKGQAKWRDLVTDSGETQRIGLLEPAFGKRTESVSREPVRNKAIADARARDILSRRLKEMVQASGSTVGLPDLRAGRTVEIVGLDQRTKRDEPSQGGNLFEGTYYVTETTHTIGANGYRTDFKARREGPAR
jgi:phage protein D